MNNTSNVRTSTLDNGIRVVTDPMDTVETISTGIWVDVGARHESPDVNGISHLLEHMAFKGTKRRNALEIAEEIEAVGGSLNAYTSRENTAYYAKILKEDLGLAVDIIADIVQNSTLAPEELERERTVIVQEINQAQDTPDDIIHDLFQETAYPDQPMGRPILGSADRVRSLPRDTILEYLADTYTPGGMILSAAGRVDHDELVKLAEDTLGGLSGGTDIEAQAAHYEGGELRQDRELEQAHIILGFDGVAFDDPDFYALGVLSTLFGGGMSSRLFQEIREKRGLVYSIYSYSASYMDGGTFAVYAGTGADEAGQIAPLVCDEINKLRDHVGEDELNRARAQIKAGILMSMESTSGRCEQLARQMMVYGRPITTAEVVEKIEAIDIVAVQRTLERITTTPPTLTSIGPISGIGNVDALAAQLA